MVFGLLLLSAVNTAIVDLIAISFLMSRDGELPRGFQKLNKFGVPNLGIIVATVIPAVLVIAVKDMAGLADLVCRRRRRRDCDQPGRQFHRPETAIS